ncbi:hypothetical protein R1flu_005157 [Riccia fluitans]|uniref:Uncharacterized protein n=1 Tax=Riccia fluitans TaxID=41844 RepID=A0ABD1YSC8_9MARC
MGKTTACILLLPLVLTVLSSRAGAVEIHFYTNTRGCNGAGFTFTPAQVQVCYQYNAGSVMFLGMTSCRRSRVYGNSGCSGVSIGSSTGSVCYYGGGIKSAYWYYICRRRSLLSDNFTSSSDTTPICKSTVDKPTGIVYTEESMTGSWMLKSPDAVNLMSQLESLPAGEKIDWLKTQGATFVALSAVQTRETNV